MGTSDKHEQRDVIHADHIDMVKFSSAMEDGYMKTWLDKV